MSILCLRGSQGACGCQRAAVLWFADQCTPDFLDGVVPGEQMRWEKRNCGGLRRGETVSADVRSICGEHGIEFSFAHYCQLPGCSTE